jgi:sarcosine oxidase, subunit beta
MKTTADVIVIGAGIVGCSTAYYLAKKGMSVIVLEGSNYIGNGGSSRNGGGVRQSGRNPKELPLMIWGVKNIWPHLSEELGVDTEYKQKGNLRLGKTDRHLGILTKLTENAVKCGLDVKMISAAEVKGINPYLSDEVVGASWCATDGHANPLTTTLGFYKKARELGVQFYTDCPVVQLRTVCGTMRQVITSEAVFEAEAVVVAAGFESKPLLDGVGINIPMRKVKLECLVTEAEPQMFEQMLGTAEADFYGHQTKHGSFVFGGHTGYERYAIDYANPSSSSSFASCTSRGIMKYFPILKDAKIVRAWAGFMDECADEVATVSKIDEIPGLYVECSFTGHGFGIGPAAGYNTAELITTGKTPADIQPLRYDRFKTAM